VRLGNEGFPKDWPLDGLADRGDCIAALLREDPPIEALSTDTFELLRLKSPMSRVDYGDGEVGFVMGAGFCFRGGHQLDACGLCEAGGAHCTSPSTRRSK
jgi:hypothetical protein